MNLKYYEKLSISIIVFLGVVVFTAYTIGLYNSRVSMNNKNKENNNNPNTIILENINLF